MCTSLWACGTGDEKKQGLANEQAEYKTSYWSVQQRGAVCWCGPWGLHVLVPATGHPWADTGWTKLSKPSYWRGPNRCVYFLLIDIHPELPGREQDEAIGAFCACVSVCSL